MDKLIVFLADGLEEIEAIATIDILRRAEIDVITCSINDIPEVKGSHDIMIKADKTIDNLDINETGGIILPGGMPGAENLKNCQKVLEFIRKVNDKQGLIAAICAAPIVLEEAGILENKMATSYPGFEKQMPSCIYQEERVVVDNNIITARGPGVVFEFTFTILDYLLDQQMVKNLQKAMLMP